MKVALVNPSEREILETAGDRLPLGLLYISKHLDNLGVINLILFSLCIIANFVDLNLTKFNKRKEADTFDEI